MITIKEYMISQLNEQLTKARRTIRLLKNEIYNLNSVKTLTQNTSENKLKEMLAGEPKLLAKYEKLASEAKKAHDEFEEQIQTVLEERKDGTGE